MYAPAAAEALDDLNAAVDLNPNNPDVYSMRAAAYRQLESADGVPPPKKMEVRMTTTVVA